MADYSSKSVVRSFGGPEKDADGNFPITQSHNMTYNDGKVYLSSLFGKRINVYQATDGSQVGSFGHIDFMDAGYFSSPAGVAFTDGKAIVCDSTSGRLHIYDLDYNFLSEVGGEGDGPGYFRSPNTICVDPASGDIFVAEDGNKRVQVLDKELNHKSFIVGPPFLTCRYVSFDSVHNRVIVSDSEAHTVSLFDPANGQLVGKLEGEKSEFKVALQSACDKTGNILLCGFAEGNVGVFDKDGKKIGILASGYKFSQPEGINISDGGEIFILEGSVATGWNRVVVF